MKTGHALLLIQNFLVENADAFDIHKRDIKQWICDQHDGLMPDHNKFYEVRALLYSYLVETREDIFRIDHKRAEKFLQKYPELLKDYKAKKGKA